MKDCIFCKISDKKSPVRIVYEDKEILAFFPLEQISRGHTLIIPKKHYENIYDIDEKSLEKIISVAKKIASSMKKSLGAKGINILHASGKDADQSIFHFHIHIIPRYNKDGLNTWPKSNYKENNVQKIHKKLKIE